MLSRLASAVVAVTVVGGAVSCVSAASRGMLPEPYAIYPPRDLMRASPLTRAERSGFTETSTHADVLAFIDTLRRNSTDLHVTTLGRTSEGRDIPLVVLSRPLVRNATEAKRSNKPIIFVQGNIHGGEVEGKEALLSLLRDLARDKFQNVVDSLVIVAAPVYNADGNDAMGPQETNRGAQNGPAIVGRRPNAQGLDLNRDYIKAEAPETRASLDFFRAWEPDVFVDLHTTDGSFHGYALTWSPPLNPAARFSGPFTRDTLLPILANTLKANERIETFPYGNFVAQDSVERGWYTYDHRPRFGTNYYGLRGRIAVLSEAYSHDPFRARIASTYTFVMELLSLIAANREDIMDVGREADRRTTAFASTANSSPPIAIRSRLTRSPYAATMLVEEILQTGDSARTEAGLRPGIRRTGRVRSVRVPVFDRFDPVLEQTVPYAWAIPAELPAVIEQLKSHGVFVERLDAATTIAGESFTIDTLTRASRPFQGHQEVRLGGRWQRTDSLDLLAGTWIVRGAQPLGILALYLLEPQSDDGLVTWNFLDASIDSGRYPIARVTRPIRAPLSPTPRN